MYTKMIDSSPMSKHAFYQTHLNQVSRSFAFCIERLDEPLRSWVGLSYLLFRLLDTIEDAPWAKVEKQNESFQEFMRALNYVEHSETWVQSLSVPMTDHEKQLLEVAPLLFRDFHQLPIATKMVLRAALENMARGMMHFANRRPLRILDLAELNQYCFFVAGLVGELLSQLRDCAVVGARPIAQENRLNAFHFGMFLQKINILKDQLQDEKEGRYLVPSRSELFASLHLHAEFAKDYLFAIPIVEKGYRLFCAWSLFLALASLPWMQSSWRRAMLDKIPRAATQILLGKIESIIGDDQQLELLYREMIASEFAPNENAAVESLAVAKLEMNWFFEIYRGEMSLQEMRELRLT